MMVPPIRCAVPGAAAAPDLLRVGRLGDREGFLAPVFPAADRVLIVAVDDARDRQPELVLVARELDAIFRQRHLLAEQADAGEPARRALHEVGERRPEQIGPRAREADIRLHRGAGAQEDAAKAFLGARLLVVVLVRHELVGLRCPCSSGRPRRTAPRRSRRVWHIRYLPTSSFRFARPFGCLSVSELSMMRGVSAA